MTSSAPRPMSPLFVELHRWAGMQFVWGSADCVTVLADWVWRARGFDPAADLRLTYGSAGECERVCGFFSDPVAVFANRLEPHGLARTDTPVAGDVGILTGLFDGVLRPHGALCLGTTWAAKSQTGVVSGVPGEIVAAWGVGYNA